MRRTILVALAALPLVGFGCGSVAPAPPVGPAPCTLIVTDADAVSERLWCVVTVYDYSRLDPTSTDYAFELAAYRGTSGLASRVGFILPARAQVGHSYGWDSPTRASNVDSGSASRYDATGKETHAADAPSGERRGSGMLSVQFSVLPAPNAPDTGPVDVHGTLTATVPSSRTGGPVTFSATF
jgi:hypothetical protein